MPPTTRGETTLWETVTLPPNTAKIIQGRIEYAVCDTVIEPYTELAEWNQVFIAWLSGCPTDGIIYVSLLNLGKAPITIFEGSRLGQERFYQAPWRDQGTRKEPVILKTTENDANVHVNCIVTESTPISNLSGLTIPLKNNLDPGQKPLVSF